MRLKRVIKDGAVRAFNETYRPSSSQFDLLNDREGETVTAQIWDDGIPEDILVQFADGKTGILFTKPFTPYYFFADGSWWNGWRSKGSYHLRRKGASEGQVFKTREELEQRVNDLLAPQIALEDSGDAA